MTTDRPIRTPRNVNDPQRPARPISQAEALAEPDAARTFPVEAPAKPESELSTTVQHRGRVITITAKNITVDRFCDLLDAAQYPAPAPQQWQTLPDGTPICPKHQIPMRKRAKQGDEWFSHQVYDGNGTELYCKGYKGKDSPGYDV